MKQKVFVLVQESVCESGTDIHVWTFSNLENAQNVLNELFENDKNEIEEIVRNVEKDENSYMVYEDGYYMTNHCKADIYDTEMDSNNHVYKGESF